MTVSSQPEQARREVLGKGSALSAETYRVSRLGLGLGLGVILLFVLLFPILTGRSRPIVDADSLYLAALFEDVRDRFGYVGGWQLQPASGLFPDGLLWFAINAVVRPLPLTFALYAVAQAGLFLHAGFLIWRCNCSISAGAYLIASLAVFSGATAIGWLFHAEAAADWYQWLLRPAAHFGGLLGFLWTLALLCRGDKPAGTASILIACIVFLCTASDLLFVPHFALPLALTAATMARWRQAAIVIAACGLGYAAARILSPAGGGYLTAHPETAVETARQLIAVILSGSMTDRLCALLVFEGVVLVFFRTLKLWRSNDDQRTNERALVTAASLSIAGALTTLIFFRMVFDWSGFRYLLPCIFLPLTWLAGWVAVSIKDRRSEFLALSLPLILSLFLLDNVARAESSARDLWGGSPEALACLGGDENQAGLAEYWRARPLSLFSHGRLQVAPLNGFNGMPVGWIANAAWITNDRHHPGQPPHYSFILTAGETPAVLLRLYGAPLRREPCGENEIWRYDPAALTPRFLERYEETQSAHEQLSLGSLPERLVQLFKSR